MAQLAGLESVVLASLRVDPGSPAHLDRRDPSDNLGLSEKNGAQGALADALVELDQLHNRLWAEAQRSVLLVLQGIDTAGKDGVIRRVLSGLNPQGCHVTSFKTPGSIERAHDYLWRVHAACPERGKLGVFNRSHYEDVLAARLLGVVDADACHRRYRHLNEFERMLSEEGTRVVKVFLLISRDEQRKRLQERLDNPVKNWKFRRDDLETRSHWDDLLGAYEETITATSTEPAPWYVVPANHKWVRDHAVAAILLDVFRSMDPQIPPPDPSLVGLRVD